MDSPTLEQILAQRSTAGRDIINVDEPVSKLVVFALNDAWFAFPGEAIREILFQPQVFFVPGCPASFEGVINVRGDIESVIKLEALLGQPPAESRPSSSVLLASGAGIRTGIRVDKVIDVVDLVQSAFQAPPATLSEAMQRIVRNLVVFKEHTVAVLDIEQLLDSLAEKAS